MTTQTLRIRLPLTLQTATTLAIGLVLGLTPLSFASSVSKKDVLVKFTSEITIESEILINLKNKGFEVETVRGQLFRLQATASKTSDRALEQTLQGLRDNPSVEFIQPNYKISLLEDYQIQDPLKRAALSRAVGRASKNQARGQARARARAGAHLAKIAKSNNLDNLNILAPKPRPDNPEIPELLMQTMQKNEFDPLLKNQWGLLDIGAAEAWKITLGTPEMIVAVIDTGVDYTHEDLLPNIWHNKNEIPNNGIDDDNNGFVDDVIGWDFAANDNKPYDLSVDPMVLLTKGGNPGHGTHCAGTIAARGGNGLGISGVAPNVKIMPLRFITEKGVGTTSAAIQAIYYAVDNGARIMSNSWGSEGEDPNDSQENKALREAIQYAQDKGVLFIAAAGNGHRSVGYDNDSNPAPAYPASYEYDNIISVAAIDSQNQLGSFSNWGPKSVDLAAPGVAIFSTTVLGNYDDHVINVGAFEIMWDGTSIAAPHVAGAAALYWSTHPEKTWQDVKAAVLASTEQIPALKDKVVSQGKLDVRALLK